MTEKPPLIDGPITRSQLLTINPLVVVVLATPPPPQPNFLARWFKFLSPPSHPRADISSFMHAGIAYLTPNDYEFFIKSRTTTRNEKAK